jgi:uncharacterized membrane protein YphA (DoxX/SURF4 family)
MKRNKIIYWAATGLISLALLASGMFNLSQAPEVIASLAHLGYPAYLGYIIGTGKVLGALALLYPGFPRLKEWAYAGVTFNMLGAGASHLFAGDPFSEAVAPFVLIGVLLVSYWAYHATKAQVASSSR